MELNRPSGQRGFRAAQGRQRFELDLHLFQGCLCILPGVRRHRQNGVPDIPDLVPAEHGAIRHLNLQEVGALDVGGGQHPGDPRHLHGVRSVNGDDACMGNRAAQNRQLERPLDFVVRREIRGAAGLGHGGRPRVGDPHDAVSRFGPDGLGSDFAAQKPAGELHGFDDLLVAGAAAQVTAQGVFDLRDRGLRVLVQQRLGGHDHAGGAEPALDRAGQNEGLLDEMRVVGGSQALHRDDVGTFQVGHPGQARPHRLAVHYHRAGAALAFPVAGLLGSGQPQILPQQIQQHGFRIDDHLAPSSIHTQSDLFHSVSSSADHSDSMNG